MIIKLTQTKSCIWVSVHHILYMNINNIQDNLKTLVFCMELDYPIEVIETPEEIIELIKQAK